MNEEEIRQQLAQRIIQPVTDASAPVDIPAQVEQDHSTVDYQLDEITQYKLHDFFGESYRQTDEVNRQRLHFIYEQIANMIDTSEYGFVVSKIRDLEQIIGISNSDNRLYKLYQWLKLDGVRKNVEAEMGVITDG